MPAKPETIAAITSKFAGLTVSEFRGDPRVDVTNDSLLAVKTPLQGEGTLDLLVAEPCEDHNN